MTLQGPTWSCLSCQSFLFLVSGKQVLCFPHLLLGESWTLTNLLRKGGTAQSNEVKLLCALFPLFSFCPCGNWQGWLFFSFLTLLSMFMHMWTSSEATTKTWQIKQPEWAMTSHILVAEGFQWEPWEPPGPVPVIVLKDGCKSFGRLHSQHNLYKVCTQPLVSSVVIQHLLQREGYFKSPC